MKGYPKKVSWLHKDLMVKGHKRVYLQEIAERLRRLEREVVAVKKQLKEVLPQVRKTDG